MKHILWQEGHNHLRAGVSLPPKLHIPHPIHTCQLLFLVSVCQVCPLPLHLIFKCLLSLLVWGFFSQILFKRFFWGPGELLTRFLAASLPHALPTLLPAPFTRCYIISKVVFYKHILKFPSFTLHSKFPSRLTTF